MPDLLNRIHNDTMRRPLHELVASLNQNLGTTLVAYMANVRSRQLPARWASVPTAPNHTEPGDQAKTRLLMAYEAFAAIEASDSAYVARQWLIAASPWFSGQTPAERIREGDAVGVQGAVRAFVEDTGGA